MDNLEKAQKIVEEVLPKYFVFRLWETEVGGDGSMTKLYTDKADLIVRFEHNWQHKIYTYHRDKELDKILEEVVLL